METQALLARLPSITSFQEALQYQGNLPVPTNPALERARSYNGELGTVILTSGLSRTSKDGNYALDFALISTNNARFPGFDVVTNVSTHPSALAVPLPSLSLCPRCALAVSHVDHFKDPCSSAINAVFENRDRFQAEELVVKTGATGTTFGKVAGLATIRLLVELHPGNTVTIESRELVILSHSQESPFSGKGDSGSVVRDAEGRVVGMVWGGLEPGCTNINMDGSPVVMNHPGWWALDLGSITFVTPVKVLVEEMQDDLRRKLDIPVTLRPLDMSSGPSVSAMAMGPVSGGSQGGS